MIDPPKVLTVVMADRTATYISLVHENEHQPWRRRTVQIRLTPEQREQLRPRPTGTINGQEQTEAIVDCWLEDD